MLLFSMENTLRCSPPGAARRGMESSVAHTIDQERQLKSRTSPWPRYDEAALGFRDYWYPAMMSHKLRRRSVGLQILGERLLFIRHQPTERFRRFAVLGLLDFVGESLEGYRCGGHGVLPTPV